MAEKDKKKEEAYKLTPSPFAKMDVKKLLEEYGSRIEVDSKKGIDKLGDLAKATQSRMEGLEKVVDTLLIKIHGEDASKGAGVPKETKLKAPGKEAMAPEYAEKLVHDIVAEAISNYEKNPSKAKAVAGDREMTAAYLQRLGINYQELKIKLVDSQNVKETLKEVIQAVAASSDRTNREIEDIKYQLRLNPEQSLDALRQYSSTKTGIRPRKDLGVDQLLSLIQTHYAAESERHQKHKQLKESYETKQKEEPKQKAA